MRAVVGGREDGIVPEDAAQEEAVAVPRPVGGGEAGAEGVAGMGLLRRAARWWFSNWLQYTKMKGTQWR